GPGRADRPGTVLCGARGRVDYVVSGRSGDPAGGARSERVSPDTAAPGLAAFAVPELQPSPACAHYSAADDADRDCKRFCTGLFPPDPAVVGRCLGRPGGAGGDCWCGLSVRAGHAALRLAHAGVAAGGVAGTAGGAVSTNWPALSPHSDL